MTFILAFSTLFFIMDPFGNIPAFLAVLRKVDKKKRTFIIIREMLIALVILIFFLFLGKHLISLLNIYDSTLNISGGVLLFLISLNMIFFGEIGSSDKSKYDDPILVPLAVPLIAGPSAIAIVTLYSKQYPNQIFVIFLALVSSWFLSSVILVFSGLINKILGKKMILAITKLMGMILITMAIQMLLTGLKIFFSN